MKITLSPYEPLPGAADALTISVHGDVLAVNGEEFDFRRFQMALCCLLPPWGTRILPGDV